MSFGYRVTVAPQFERKEVIEQKSKSPAQQHTSYDVYEGKPTTMPVINLPIGMPVYRMDNGRTQTEQMAYISEKELDSSYFKTGEENESVQQIQHEILRKFAKEGTDSISPIINELERTKQTEPILITQAGVVVNGNRRLSAMRELYFERPNDFPTFACVECAVLPVLTSAQIEDIEIRLQMTPETKLPYRWVDECLKIDKQIQCGRKEEEIAHLMRKKSAEIKKCLLALKYADIYLSDWKKRPRDYRLVDAGEQFFKDLVARLKNKDGDLLEANMRMAWLLFDNRTSLGGRIYDFNKIIGEKAQDVLTNLAERVELDIVTDANESEGFDDLLVSLDDATPTQSPYRALIATLDNELRRDEMADELRAVCQTIIDASRTAKEGRSALGAAQDAHNRLVEIDLSKADPKTYEAIEKQLDEVIRKATELKSKLLHYMTNSMATQAE